MPRRRLAFAYAVALAVIPENLSLNIAQHEATPTHTQDGIKMSRYEGVGATE